MKYDRSILPNLTRVGMFEVILKNNFIFKKVGILCCTKVLIKPYQLESVYRAFEKC